MTNSSDKSDTWATQTWVSANWANTLDDEFDDKSVSLSTALVAQICGREALCAKIGPDESRIAIERCIARMERSAEAFGGTPLQTPADQVIARFDNVDNAVRSAIEMQTRVAALPPISGVRLTLKVGLSHGALTQKTDLKNETITAMATDLSRLANRGQIVICIYARTMLSAEMKTRFEAYCRSQKPVAAPAQRSTQRQKDGARNRAPCLLLQFAGKTHRLNEFNPILRIGRIMDNDVVLRGNHASRQHAVISRRGDQIVFTDTSTHGTFVSFNGEPPHLLLVKKECILRDTGFLAFSTADPMTGIGTAKARFSVQHEPTSLAA